MKTSMKILASALVIAGLSLTPIVYAATSASTTSSTNKAPVVDNLAKMKVTYMKNGKMNTVYVYVPKDKVDDLKKAKHVEMEYQIWNPAIGFVNCPTC